MRDDHAPGPDEPRPDPQQDRAAARVRGPALLLMTVSLLNLLSGIYLLVNSIVAKQQGPTPDFQKQWDAMRPEDRALFDQNGWTADDVYLGIANGSLWYGGAAALLSVLTLTGARNMRMLRSYPLAMTSAVLTAIPCVTPCCVLGQVAGVWAFIILVQSDVRAAFQ